MTVNENYSPWIQCDLKQWGPLTNERYLIQVNKKTIVYDQEEVISRIYILKRGRVRLSYTSQSGTEKIYMFGLPGCMFGEESCFEPEAQFLHAFTITNCQFYCIPKDEFLYALSQDIALNDQVISSMSHKIHVLMEHLRRLCFLSAKSRIAGVFVDLSHVFGVPISNGIRIELPVIQQGIGNLVNVSRLTVSQVINEFKMQGLLEKKHGRWIIYDLETLKELSRGP